MSNLKDQAQIAGNKVVDKAKEVGQKIAEGASRAVDYVKEKTGLGTNIQERMNVVASCGKKVGVVDHVEGNAIKLTRKDSPDNMHHFIPVDWVEKVDNEVHLKKNSSETERSWKSTAESCGCS